MKNSPYIAMVDAGKSPSGKTSIWQVVNIYRDSEPVGTIRWHGAWRRYVFDAADLGFYDQFCLNQIAGFLERATKDHGNPGRTCMNCGRKMQQLDDRGYTWHCECMPKNMAVSIGGGHES